MPTIKRIITETIQRKTEAKWAKVCCTEMNTANQHDVGPKLWSGALTLNGRPALFCPYCGEKVIYDDEVILPEGYRRVSA